MGSAGPALTEQTLQAIQNCMTRSPAPWPDKWMQEYLETIRKAVESHQDATYYDVRLEILREGFTPCWEGLTKKKDRPLFEVYRCRMRWYVEHLMGTEFPSEDERQKLRNQYTGIWDYAACSLVAQFPFLDANAVQAAKTDDLSICYRKIDAPLCPEESPSITKQEQRPLEQQDKTAKGGGAYEVDYKSQKKSTSVRDFRIFATLKTSYIVKLKRQLINAIRAFDEHY